MIRVLQEQRTVYRSEKGRRGRLTKLAAYRDAAWHAWCAEYACTCSDLDPDSDRLPDCPAHSCACICDRDDGQWCAACKRAAYRRKVIDRLARWLMWRDLRIEMLRFADPSFREAFNALVLKRKP